MTSVVGFGAVELGRVREVRREQRGRRLGVLEDHVARPGPSSAVSVLPSDHLPGLRWNVQVRPSLDVVPALRPVADELELGVVLDERRVDVREDDVRDRAVGHERVHRVERGLRPHADEAAVRLRLLRRSGSRGRRHRDARMQRTMRQSSLRAVMRSPAVRGGAGGGSPPGGGGYALGAQPATAERATSIPMPPQTRPGAEKSGAARALPATGSRRPERRSRIRGRARGGEATRAGWIRGR